MSLSPSLRLAREDAGIGSGAARFSACSRPVIRWIKGDGLDDPITLAAIAQATRLFGSTVDYCLCTDGIDAARAREIGLVHEAVEPEELDVHGGMPTRALRVLVEMVSRTHSPRCPRDHP